MATIKFNGIPVEASALEQLTFQMKIPGHAALRQAVRDRIYKVWPELKTGIPVNSPMIKSKRDIELSLEEQSALGHGFWDIYQDEKTMDQVRNMIIDLSAPGKVSVSKWLKKKIAELPPLTELIPSDEDEGMSDVVSEDPIAEPAISE